MKILYSIPHVTLWVTDEDILQLKIEDTELFDTFDDIFTEQFDIVDYEHSTENKGDLTIYTIHFPKTVDPKQLLDALMSLDEKEVERIFQMNNPKTKKTYR